MRNKINQKKQFIVEKKFKGIFTLRCKKKFYRIYVDKNNSVYDITNMNIISWKFINGNKKVPDKISEYRDRKLFDMLYGQPRQIVERKIELINSLEIL